jgi:hypothetical protein
MGKRGSKRAPNQTPKNMRRKERDTNYGTVMQYME